MTAFDYVTLDVFTATRFGGNPLAVVPDARGLRDEDMQRIATEFNYSESTFVLPPADPANTARVRIFSPTAEMPFAGHPNVGTAFVLGRQGSVFGRPIEDHVRFEERAGLVEADLIRDGGIVAGATIKAPRGLEIGATIDVETVAACASIRVEDIATERHVPVAASVGLEFKFAELTNLEALRRARPNPTAFVEADGRYPTRDDLFSLFLYVRRAGEGPASRGAKGEHLVFRARMFAPLDNVPEDPATGSASAALAAYIASLRPEADFEGALVVEQGIEMGRPSRLELRVRKRAGVVQEVTVGGRCVPVMRGVLDV
ncbi:MAG TPA: PhzF family phenazine biosynthesis protein [Polyangiaceae bacterium]|nr:PhzF family phenazine biosynthesis protein [Polyangiaceae bacterium]